MSSHWYCDCGERVDNDESCPKCHPEDRYQPIIDELRQDNDRLREALEFYADPKNAPLDPGIELWPEGEKPFGERARIALRDDSVDQ